MFRIVCLVIALAVVTNAYRRICYHSNWSQYRNSPAKFFPENINSSLCTHVIYAFATLNGNHLKAFEWNDESTSWSKGMYERFNAMKKQNPNVKTMLAVGGWNLGSAPFTKIAASDASRTDFATDAVKFLRTHDFDGLDFDWEYPANRGSPPQDKQNFVELVKKTRELFDSDAQSTGKPRLILSAATGAGKEKIETAYDFPQLIRYLDMINMMTYDLHGSFEDHTGHNSPLKAGPMDTGDDATLNVEWAAHEYVRRGVPKSMLNIGMPLYGRSFTLSSTSNNGVNAPVSGGGTAGRYTREAGFLAYYEICEMMPGAQKHIIQGEEVPYLVQGNQWVGYDDQESLRKKVDFVKQENFGGVMVWDLALDDFSGSCGEGKYPLLNAINDELRRVDPNMLISNQTDATVSGQMAVSTVPPQATTVPSAGAASPCTNTGLTTTSGNSGGYRRVCYHTNWSQYRHNPVKFFPENINSSLCTHIIYAFATLDGNHLKAFEWNDESTSSSKGMYERFNAMKKTNPTVKTMLAVGGWKLGSGPFTRIAATPASRQDFATDAVRFLRTHDFDGLDFDWEYPTYRGSPAQDKQNFVSLVKTTRETFDADAQATGKPRLILSAATGAGQDKIQNAYDLPQLSKYLDMYNLMTYDFHGTFDHHTGHNSPLKAGPMDTGIDRTLNVEWAAAEYVRQGVPSNMINIGMPLYAKTFTLSDTSQTGVNAPISGGGNAGRYTHEKGVLAYFEVCEMVNQSQKHIIQGQEVPYLVKGDQWISYDDPESLRKKVDLVKQEHYGGIMVWDLDLDDFKGMCGEGKYPLMNAINDELRCDRSAPMVTNIPTLSPTLSTAASLNPQTPAPQTVAPQTAAPQTAAPQTAAPQTAAPQTAAPQTAAPQTAAPQTAVPQTSTTDCSTSNCSSPDCGTSDCSSTDRGTSNCSTTDCGTSNCSTTDCSTSNCSTTDCSTPNCSTTDCGTSNCSSPDCVNSNCSSTDRGTSNCSTTDCGTSNCSTTDCGTSNCSTTDCGTSNCSTSNCSTTDCGYSNCSTTDCGTSNCSTTDCGTSNCSTPNCSTTDCGTSNCSSPDCVTSNCSSTDHGTSNCSTTDCGTSNCSTTDCGTSNCSTTDRSTSNCSTTDCGYSNCSTTDCGTTDCGTSNCSTTDCGTSNCSTTDCGTSDCSSPDCGTTDCVTSNCSSTDCGTSNCSTTDCGTSNCSTTDCGYSNCSTTDCGTTDCGTSNCSTTDCGTFVCFAISLKHAAQTAAPQTAAPQTAAPQTAAPQTAPPQTAAPQTAAPQTVVPQTAAPQTAAPQTAAPQTAATQTAVPQTAAPQTVAPQTAVPQTAAPQTAAPQTAAPQTAAPQTAAPQTAAPQTAAPQTSAPQTAAPQTSSPQTAAPQTVAPQTSAPQTAPSTSSPGAHHTIGTSNNFDCASHGTGFYPSPADCSKYFICAGGSAFEVACTPGLLFNPISSFCDSPSNVQCNGAPIPPTFTQMPVVMTTSGTNAPVKTTPTTTSTTTSMTSSTTTPTTTSTTTPVPTTTPAPTPVPTQPLTTKSHHHQHQPVPPKRFCHGKHLGLHPDPDHCAYFYECASGLAFHERCGTGTLFNPKTLNCDFPYHVHCGSSGR